VQQGADKAAAVAVLLRSSAAKDSPGVVWLEENILPDVFFLISRPWHGCSFNN
jgi:hypothetical protein